MFKFKVGQTVRHIDNPDIYGEVKGMEFYNDDKVYAISIGGEIEHFIEEVLSKMYFIVGDRVECIDKGDVTLGMVGVIVDVEHGGDSEELLVDFDGFTRGHDGIGKITHDGGKSGWWVRDYNVQLLPPIVDTSPTPEPPLLRTIPDASERIGGLVKDLGAVFGIRSSARLENLLKSDQVNHPSHYTLGGIETIDFIKAKMTHEQFEGYLLGNIIKYLTRYNHKGNAVQDLEKATTYLNWLTEHIKGE